MKRETNTTPSRDALDARGTWLRNASGYGAGGLGRLSLGNGLRRWNPDHRLVSLSSCQLSLTSFMSLHDDRSTQESSTDAHHHIVQAIGQNTVRHHATAGIHRHIADHQTAHGRITTPPRSERKHDERSRVDQERENSGFTSDSQERVVASDAHLFHQDQFLITDADNWARCETTESRGRQYKAVPRISRIEVPRKNPEETLHTFFLGRLVRLVPRVRIRSLLIQDVRNAHRNRQSDQQDRNRRFFLLQYGTDEDLHAHQHDHENDRRAGIRQEETRHERKQAAVNHGLPFQRCFINQASKSNCRRNTYCLPSTIGVTKEPRSSILSQMSNKLQKPRSFFVTMTVKAATTVMANNHRRATCILPASRIWRMPNAIETVIICATSSR